MLVSRMAQYHMTFPNDVADSLPEFYKLFLQELCILATLPICDPNLTIKAIFQEHHVGPQHFLNVCDIKKPQPWIKHTEYVPLYKL